MMPDASCVLKLLRTMVEMGARKNTSRNTTAGTASQAVRGMAYAAGLLRPAIAPRPADKRAHVFAGLNFNRTVEQRGNARRAAQFRRNGKLRPEPARGVAHLVIRNQNDLVDRPADDVEVERLGAARRE